MMSHRRFITSVYCEWSLVVIPVRENFTASWVISIVRTISNNRYEMIKFASDATIYYTNVQTKNWKLCVLHDCGMISWSRQLLQLYSSSCDHVCYYCTQSSLLCTTLTCYADLASIAMHTQTHCFASPSTHSSRWFQFYYIFRCLLEL